MVSSILGKDLMKVVWIMQALGALIIGLMALNIDVFASMQSNVGVLVKPIQILLGLSGLAGLVELLAGCGDCCSK